MAPRKAKGQVEPRFGPKGQRLWAELADVVDGERGRVLLEEACRIADRLDKLDELLRGDVDVWCRLTHRLLTKDYEVKVDGALIEARQQAGVLRLLIAGLPVKEAAGDVDDPDAWLASLSS